MTDFFFLFQPETLVTMENLPSKSNPSEDQPKPQNITFKQFVTNHLGIVLALLTIAAFFGALICIVLILPRACNKNPQNSIMKLESQVQNLGLIFKDWLNCDSKLAVMGKYFLGFCLAVFGYFLHDFGMKISFIGSLTFAVFYSIFLCHGVLLARDYIFEDSNDTCKLGLTAGLERIQQFSLYYSMLLIFIKIQQILSAKCKNLN